MAFELSEKTDKRIREEILPRYPFKKSAILPVLWAIQEEKGHLCREALLYAAQVVEQPPAHVYSVLTFYTMFFQQPIGRFHLQVCKTASCEIMGCRQITDRLRQRLGIDVGQTTADGLFTLSQVECLAACELAPMIQVNEDYYGPLTPEKVDELLEDLKSGRQQVKPCL